MSGLIDAAGGDQFHGKDAVDNAREAWEESMERRLELLRDELRDRNIGHVSNLCGAKILKNQIVLRYWDQDIAIEWDTLSASLLANKEPCSTFDNAMLLYYLNTADGTSMADSWIGFRELPDGGFYHQAFQGYSGNKIAAIYGNDPDQLVRSAAKIGGEALPSLAPYAYAFTPLPRIRLAVALWPGDEDFPSRASVLFDASSSHYLPTDGLALLGSGLAGRLIKAKG